MAEVVLFHHAQGLTRASLPSPTSCAGRPHVHTPDCSRRTFGTLEEGALCQGSRSRRVIRRGEQAVEDLPAGWCTGFSLGVLPAQKLAQTRPGARGRCFYFLRSGRGVRAWPEGAVQVHGRTPTRSSSAKATSTPPASSSSSQGRGAVPLPGDQHYFADSSCRLRRGGHHPGDPRV